MPRSLKVKQNCIQKVKSVDGKDISLNTQGTCNKEEIFQILVRAASNKDSIENTSKILEKSSTGRKEVFLV